MSVLKKIEKALKEFSPINYKEAVISDNLSVYQIGFKGQEIIFAIYPVNGIYDVAGLNTFLTNVFNHIGIKENYDIFECEETDKVLVLACIKYAEVIGWLTEGDFANITLKPDIEIVVDKKELSIINVKPTRELKRYISVVLCPDKEALDYALKGNNIPLNCWKTKKQNVGI